VAWEIEFKPPAEQWLKGLGAKDRARVAGAIDALREHGPHLSGRRASLIHGSHHHNMKELRSVGGHIRILFAFDHHQRGVVLLGGDKTNDWEGWYKRNIRVADRLYDEHLRSIGKEPPWLARARTGERSAGRSR
jgi:hypothetical protein